MKDAARDGGDSHEKKSKKENKGVNRGESKETRTRKQPVEENKGISC